MKIKVIISNGINEWEEKISIQSIKTAKKEVQEVIDKYNSVEIHRYGDTAVLRKLVKLIKG